MRRIFKTSEIQGSYIYNSSKNTRGGNAEDYFCRGSAEITEDAKTVLVQGNDSHRTQYLMAHTVQHEIEDCRLNEERKYQPY